MPKQKFNNFDICAEVACLRKRCVGMWLTNVYDLDNKRTFLFKFSRSGGATESGEGEKVTVLMESGARFHSTSYTRERKSDAPSKFNMKLRQHLRSKRLNAVTQYGSDRAVDFTFSAGDGEHHLILELYAQGNLVLTDKDYKVLTLLRTHRDDNKGVVLLGNHPYPRERFRPFRRLARDEMEDALEGKQPGATAAASTAAAETVAAAAATDSTETAEATEESAQEVDLGAAAGATSSDAGVSGEGAAVEGGNVAADSAAAFPPPAAAAFADRTPKTVREALCRSLGHGPPMIDHAARAAGLTLGGATPLPLVGAAEIDALFAQLSLLDDWFEGVATNAVEPEGIIVLKKHGGGGGGGTGVKDTKDGREASHDDGDDGFMIYDEFSPLSLMQHHQPVCGGEGGDGGVGPQTTTRVKRVEGGFDAALDDYFATAEAQVERLARERAEKTAVTRLDKVRRDQETRAAQLGRETDKEEARATLIEYNLEQVDTVLVAVNSALAGGMAWDDLEQMIRQERRSGNPVAQLIQSLDLPNNRVTVNLANHLDDAYEDGGARGEEEVGEAGEEVEKKDAAPDTKSKSKTETKQTTRRSRGPKTVAVELELGMSAYANARAHFERRKKHAVKHDKTLAQNQRAVAAAEKRAKESVGRNVAKGPGGISKTRTPLWFEKFHWFITSENCLVVSARDATQADLLLRRYLAPADAFVHADLPGAPVTVVKPPPARDEDGGGAGEGHAVINRADEAAGAAAGAGRQSDRAGWCGGVPPLSLVQAGAACLCRSSAWDSRHVISAWWVRPENIRKATPEGDPLAPGVVWTVGERNFLPPAPLIMGFGFMFQLAEEAGKDAHLGDRTTRGLARSLPGDTGDDESGGGGEAEDDDATAEAVEEEQEGEEEDGDGLVFNSASEREEGGGGGDSAHPATGKQTGEDATALGKSSALDAFLDGGVDFGGHMDSQDPVSEEGKKIETAGLGDDADNADDADDAGKEGGSKHLSAKERRLMRKQRKNGGGGGGGGGGTAGGATTAAPAFKPSSKPSAGDGSNDDNDGVGHSTARGGRDDTQPQQQKPHPPPQPVSSKPLPRGKSAKAKRAATRYADQDEDDRALAMALMAAAGKGNEKGGKKGGAQAEAEVVDVAAAKRQQPQPQRQRQNGGSVGGGDGGSGGRGRGGGSGAEKKTHGERDASDVGRRDDDTDDDTDGDGDGDGVSARDPAAAAAALAAADAERVSKVDWFTGAPFHSDVLTFAVPVVAPYAALQSYRYKVKLTPGSQKKGKAAKQAMDVLLRLPGGGGGDAADKEKDKVFDAALKALMKAADGGAGGLAPIMCGSGVKVSMPAGAAKAINASRKKGGK